MPWRYRDLERVLDLWVADDSPDHETQAIVLTWLMRLADDPALPESVHAGAGFPPSARLAQIPGTRVCFLFDLIETSHEIWAAWMNTI